MDTSEFIVLNDWIITHFHKGFFSSKVATAETNPKHLFQTPIYSEKLHFSSKHPHHCEMELCKLSESLLTALIAECKLQMKPQEGIDPTLQMENWVTVWTRIKFSNTSKKYECPIPFQKLHKTFPFPEKIT